MENNPNLPNHVSMQEVLRMAASPAGQQLIAMLRKQSGSDFQAAMSSAASGDYTQAKQAIEKTDGGPTGTETAEAAGEVATWTKWKPN